MMQIAGRCLEDTLASLIPMHATLMASYERGLNQPTMINCLQEALLAALIMVNIAQMNSSYGMTAKMVYFRSHC